MFSGSTGAQAGIRKAAKFDWSINFIPYYDDVKGAPQNSIIGGASVWSWPARSPMTTRRGQVLRLPLAARGQMEWHTSTGYVPITQALTR